jgi:hypothetical protein
MAATVMADGELAGDAKQASLALLPAHVKWAVQKKVTCGMLCVLAELMCQCNRVHCPDCTRCQVSSKRINHKQQGRLASAVLT